MVLRKSLNLCFMVMLASAGLLVTCAGCGKGPPAGSAKRAFEVDRVYERGPVIVHVRLDKTELTTADTILLQLEVTAKQGHEVRMPNVESTFEEFGLVDWQDLGERLDDSGRVVTTRQYRLEPFLLGEGEVPGLTFEYHDVNEPDTKNELTTDPIAVEIASAFAAPQGEAAIEDIEDVVDMPKEPLAWWLTPAIGLCAVGLAVVGWLLWRRGRAREAARIFRPAHEVAYARLQALARERLVENGFVKPFYERVSGILRHYIEDRFELRAPERTTEEFMAEARETNVLSADDKKALEEFLTHCDLVKFAKHSPASDQIDRTFDLVGEFIERTRSDEHKVDVTDEVQLRQAIEAVAGGAGLTASPDAGFEAN